MYRTMEHSRFVLAGLMGCPVAHSRSPNIHNHWIAEYGLRGAYVLLPVAPANLAQALRALPVLGFAGCNLTIPHKVAAMALVDSVEPVARRSGAINTIVWEPAGARGGEPGRARGRSLPPLLGEPHPRRYCGRVGGGSSRSRTWVPSGRVASTCVRSAPSYSHLLREDLAVGRVVRVLPTWSWRVIGIYLLLPVGQHPPRRTVQRGSPARAVGVRAPTPSHEAITTPRSPELECDQLPCGLRGQPPRTRSTIHQKDTTMAKKAAVDSSGTWKMARQI